MDDLSKKSCKDLENAYMDMMEGRQKSNGNGFEMNTDNSEADVKAFVNKMLPTLRMQGMLPLTRIGN